MAKQIKNKVLACKKLIEECESQIFSGGWDGYKVRGIDEISRNELDTIITYAQYYIQHETTGGLMPPDGKVYEVLRIIDIVEKSPWLFE